MSPQPEPATATSRRNRYSKKVACVGWIVGLQLGLRLLPLRMLLSLLSRLRTNHDAQAPDMTIAREMASVVRSCGRRIGGGQHCLTQALALQILMGRQGQPCELCIGVRKDVRGCLQAHAWVQAEGQVVLGDLPDLDSYRPLYGLPSTRTTGMGGRSRHG